MSQTLTPINGGIQEIQTSPRQRRLKVLSSQYIQTKHLESRPTEWVAEGRPIYRRLPGASDTYQINFFDILPATNTAVRGESVVDTGYVYVPWGEGIFGPISLEVVSSESREDLIIKAGQVVWKYGTTPVPPALVNLREVEIGSGKFLVAYQLVYDDTAVENYYSVDDYSLAGTPLIVESSSDSIVGWRFEAINAFQNTDTNYWSNKDNYFPTYAQPVSSYLQWQSNDFFQSSLTDPNVALPSAYSKITLRCPAGTSITGSATLSYVQDSVVSFVSEVPIQVDTTGQYFSFDITEPSFQTGWKIEFSDLNVKIQSITVSGIVTKATRQAEPTTRCALSIYPADAIPTTVVNSKGEDVPAVFCKLAYIDVDQNYLLTDISDIRPIIHRDYKPIADWLTRPFDEDLISLYEQVKGYSTLWMSPTESMAQEYTSLAKYDVELV